MEENKNALNEINKGCTIGIEAIENLISKVDNKDFKKLLEKQLKQYTKFEDEINDLYSDYSEDCPQEIGFFNKIMNDCMISMETMKDSTDSKIAELLLQGTNMGIIEGKKILNNKKIDKKVIKIVEEFVNHQEMIVEELKKYL